MKYLFILTLIWSGAHPAWADNWGRNESSGTVDPYASCNSVSGLAHDILSNGDCCPGFRKTGDNSMCSWAGALQEQTGNSDSRSVAGSNSNLSNIGQKCEEETKAALDTCDFSKNKEAQAAMAMGNQMKAQIQATAMASPAALCSGFGKVTQAFDAASAAFGGYCTNAYTSCEDACNSDISQLEAQMKANPSTASLYEERVLELKKTLKQCSKLQSNINNVLQSVGSYAAMQTAKSQYCGDQTNALAALCKSQPSNALCKTSGSANCSDPNVAASNIVCICQTNPNDPRCGAQNSIGLQAGYNGSGAASGGGSGSADGSLGDFGGVGGGDIMGGSNAMGSHDGGAGGMKAGFGGGRGGGGGLGGGGGGPAAGRPGAGGAAGGAAGANTKIISGYGVGGASGSAVGRAGGYGGQPGGPGAQPGKNGYLGANGKPVDLRKFLPGGQMDPSRGLAGAAGPDGITGPNTDIWQKVQNRYFSISPSLLP